MRAAHRLYTVTFVPSLDVLTTPGFSVACSAGRTRTTTLMRSACTNAMHIHARFDAMLGFVRAPGAREVMHGTHLTQAAPAAG